MTFVALPSTFGPLTASATEAMPSSTTATSFHRSGRSTPSSRRPDSLKFSDFSPGMPMPPPIGPMPPPRGGRRRAGAGAFSVSALMPPPPR
jgi:hypothetical protein